MHHLLRPMLGWALLAGLFTATPAWAQDPEPDAPVTVPQPDTRVEAPLLDPRGRYDLYWNERSLWDLVQWFSDMQGENFIIAEKKDLEGKKVTIISHRKVSAAEAWEAFVSALEVNGLTLVKVGKHYKIVKQGEAGQKPLEIRIGNEAIPYSDRVITQLLPLSNISVNEITKVISSMAPSSAKVVAYVPTNTLIITDTAHNLRKIQELVKELDTAAPESTLAIYPVVFADSAEIAKLIEELYGTAEKADKSSASDRRGSSRRRRRTARRDEPEPTSNDPLTAGEKSNYISKVMDDERTNSLIVLANEEGHNAVKDLLSRLDIETVPSRAQIHVVRLEHAKAEDITKVLNQLSEQPSRGRGRGSGSNSDRSVAERRAAEARRAAANENNQAAANPEGEEGSVTAAFDSGMRIAADDNTNALIIIASQEDFRVIKGVIDELDVVRRQVFVDAVVLEISGQDGINFGLSGHVPMQVDNDTTGLISSQFGGINSLTPGLSQDLLSGLAAGVFGQSISVDLGDGTSLEVPAFGIALNAIKTNGQVNIVSNPNLLTLDNEKAKIVVGRKIPFPTTSGLNNLGQPVVSFQREDVAITLEVTPRVNSSNFVTLELKVEVQEVEDSETGDSNFGTNGGFITSKREVETTALVKDNQTVVLGGLVNSTENRTESKVPVLGDIPLIGALFRSTKTEIRKSNLMVFLTPHIIDDEEDMWEIQRVKEAQRQEFMRRFFGRSSERQKEELRRLLQYSMNYVDHPSMFRGPTELGDLDFSEETKAEIELAIQESRGEEPGAGAGSLPTDVQPLVIEDELALPETPDGQPVEMEGPGEESASPSEDGEG